MTEDNEEKRFSRKKSAVKGPFIEDSKSKKQPDKKPKAKPKQEEVKEQKEQTESVEEPPIVPEEPREKDPNKIKGGKPVFAPTAPLPESRRDRKKREKEEKRAQIEREKEAKRNEKLQKAESKKKKADKKSRKEVPPVKDTNVKSKKSPEKQPPAQAEVPVDVKGKEKIAEPEVPEVEKEPEAVPEPQSVTGEEEIKDEPTEEKEMPEVPAAAETTSEELESPEAETPVPAEEETPKDEKLVPEEEIPPIAAQETEPSKTLSKKELKKERKSQKKQKPQLSADSGESKRDKKRREKEEKRKRELVERETRKKEFTPKIKGMKKPVSDFKKRTEVTSPKDDQKLPVLAPPDESESDDSNMDNDERVSRFSLKKFVTAYRDRQSILVRQAEIKRFQSALFPKVMARKWQTAITPSLEIPTKGVELPSVPTHMKMGLFFFRNFYSKRQKNDKLETDLRKAKMPYSAIQYYSMITIVVILAGLVGIIGISVFSLVTGMFLWYAFPALGGIVGLIALMALNSPSSLVNKRKKDIDSKLPMALAYIATMASADVPVETIMYELGKSYEYGEIAKEARAISASSRLFGNDIVTALREESKYSPSLKFSEFLQGITSTVTSGGNLKDYFTMKAVQFQSELSTVIRANAESVGVLAESYVTVGVAFPLMLLVILGVMAALSPSGGGGLTLVLYMVVLVIIPAITFGFTFLVSSTVKEVDV